ncbi:MAG: hypothetical protein AAB582_01750 [Patescibacteria group bacterium]
MRSLILATAAILCTTGCSPKVAAPSESDARAVIQKTTYAKDDRSGLCFSVLFSRNVGQINASSTSHTLVPCEKVEHLIH